MTFHDAQLRLKNTLRQLYDSREAATISDWVMEKLTGMKKIDRLVHREAILSEPQLQLLDSYSTQLAAHRPVQYVLNEADFCGLRLYVDENVLIPRPETEELVDWILQEGKKVSIHGSQEVSILDIGTGSGAIPIALKTQHSSFQLTACDISEAALDVARRNAHTYNASISFVQLDILDVLQWLQLAVYDIIVSNPPYIPEADKKTMSENVLEFEPHLALFTPGNDAFVFYRAIAAFGRTHLSKDGELFFEIHHEGADTVSSMLHNTGYRNIEVRNDLFGNPRMVRAQR